VLNLSLLLLLSALGVATYGAMYALFIAGAAMVYYLVSSFVRLRAPERAVVAGLGCAWGWLSAVNGVLRSAPASLVIGVIAFVLWIGPHLVRRRG